MWASRCACFVLGILLMSLQQCDVASGSRVDVQDEDPKDRLSISFPDGAHWRRRPASTQTLANMKIINLGGKPVTIVSVTIVDEQTFRIADYDDFQFDPIENLPAQLFKMQSQEFEEYGSVELLSMGHLSIPFRFLPRYPVRLEDSNLRKGSARGIPGEHSTPHWRSNVGYVDRYGKEDEDIYVVKATIQIHTEYGTLTYPWESSTVRQSPYGLPDTVTFHTRLPHPPYKQFDCFDLHLSNPSDTEPLNIWQASFSRKDLMELRFDVEYSISPAGNSDGRENPDWRGQGAQVMVPKANEVYMATICAKPDASQENIAPDNIIDSDFPESIDENMGLGYLQLITTNETLYLWLQRAVPLDLYPSDHPKRLYNGLNIVTDNAINFEPVMYKFLEDIPIINNEDEVGQTERMPPFPEPPLRTQLNTRVKVHPAVGDIRLLPDLNQTIRISFDLENAMDRHVRILSGTHLLPQALVVDSIGVEVIVRFENVTLPGESYDFGTSHRTLPPNYTVKNAVTLVCELNTTKASVLMEARIRPIQFFGEIVFHATTNMLIEYDDWMDDKKWNPMKEAHLQFHLPFSVTTTAGKMQIENYNEGLDSYERTDGLFFDRYGLDHEPKRRKDNVIQRSLRVSTDIPMRFNLSSAVVYYLDPVSNESGTGTSVCDSFTVDEIEEGILIDGRPNNRHTVGYITLKYHPDVTKLLDESNGSIDGNVEFFMPHTCYLSVLTTPIDASIKHTQLTVHSSMVEVTEGDLEGSYTDILSAGSEFALQPINGFSRVFSKLESSSWTSTLRTTLEHIYNKKPKNGPSEKVFRHYLLHLCAKVKKVPRKFLDPILLELGAIGHGETQATSIYFTNNNPVPVKVLIDVGEVQGMSVVLAQNIRRGKGDGNNILDYLPTDDANVDETIIEGKWAGHTRSGLRQFLLSSDLAQSLLGSLSHRDAVSLSHTAIQKNPHLWSLYHGSLANVTFRSKSNLVKNPPPFGNCTDYAHPAVIISSDFDLKHGASICPQERSKEVRHSQVTIPPGGKARFEVKVRAPQKKFLKRDVTPFLHTGLVLFTESGQVMPIIATYEALLGQLKVEHSAIESESESESEKCYTKGTQSPLYKDIKVIKVPIGLFENFDCDISQATPVIIPPGNADIGTPAFALNDTKDAHSVSLFLTSSFSGDVCLRKVESCNPLFTVDPEAINKKEVHETDEDPENPKREDFRPVGVEIGTLHSFISCLSSSVGKIRSINTPSTELPEFPSFYQCALDWLENRSILQPRGCGVTRKQSFNQDIESYPIEDVAVERAILALKNVVSYLNLSYGGWQEFNARFDMLNSDKSDAESQITAGMAMDWSVPPARLSPERVQEKAVQKLFKSIIARSPDLSGKISDIQLNNMDAEQQFAALVEVAPIGVMEDLAVMFRDGQHTHKVVGVADETCAVPSEFSGDGGQDIIDDLTSRIPDMGANVDKLTNTIKATLIMEPATPTHFNTAETRTAEPVTLTSGKGDGTVSSNKISMFAEAVDAWKTVSELGLNIVSADLKATIDYSYKSRNGTVDAGTCRKENAPEISKIGKGPLPLTVSMHELVVQASLTAPRLFNPLRAKQPLDRTSSSKDEELSILHFPPTLISNVAGLMLPLRNPTSVPVRVRLAAISDSNNRVDNAGKGDEFSSKGARERFLTTRDAVYVQNRKTNLHEDFGGQLWWEGGGSFFLCDDEGNMIQSYHNVTIRAGSGAHVSLLNPSLQGMSAFLLNCGTRCGDRDDMQDQTTYTQADQGIGRMPKQFTPIGAAAAAGMTLLGRPRFKADGKLSDIDELYIEAGGAGPSLKGPAPFAVPYSALDEIILPPYSEGVLGPLLFRPPGRRSVLGCSVNQDSDQSKRRMHEACNKKYFESMIFLENSLTGLERVVLRGQGTWERVIFLDPDPEEGQDGESYGDIEYRHGRSTLVFPGISESDAPRAVVKRVVVHNAGDVEVDFRQVYFSDAAIGHLTDKASLHESNTDKNTFEIGRGDNKCATRNFRLLGCQDDADQLNDNEKPHNIALGFRLLPGENRTLYIEHHPDCTLRQEYVSLNLEYWHNNRTTGALSPSEGSVPGFLGLRRTKANQWEKSFRKRKITLLVGFDMSDATIVKCRPVQRLATASPISNFYDGLFGRSSKQSIDSLTFNNTVGGDYTYRAPARGCYLEGLLVFLVLLLFGTYVAHGVHSRDHSCKSFRASIQGNIRQGKGDDSTHGTNMNNSEWSAAFRCLARADPTSSELQLLGREQVRQVVSQRYKSMGIFAPKCISNFGINPQDKPGRNSNGGIGSNGKESNTGGGEKIRTLSEAIFQSFAKNARQPEIMLPCGLGWRAAAARGISDVSFLKYFRLPQKVRDLEKRRYNNERSASHRPRRDERQTDDDDRDLDIPLMNEEITNDAEKRSLEEPKEHIKLPTINAENANATPGDDGFSQVISTSRGQRNTSRQGVGRVLEDDNSTIDSRGDDGFGTIVSTSESEGTTIATKENAATISKLKTNSVSRLVGNRQKEDRKNPPKNAKKEQRVDRSDSQANSKPDVVQLSDANRKENTSSKGGTTNNSNSVNLLQKKALAVKPKKLGDAGAPGSVQLAWGTVAPVTTSVNELDHSIRGKANGSVKPNEKKIAILQNARQRRRGSGDTGTSNDLYSVGSFDARKKTSSPKKTESLKKKKKATKMSPNVSSKGGKGANSASAQEKKGHVQPSSFHKDSHMPLSGKMMSSSSPRVDSPSSLVKPLSPVICLPPGLAPPPGFGTANISNREFQPELQHPIVPSLDESHPVPSDLLSLLVPRAEETEISQLIPSLGNFNASNEPLLAPMAVSTASFLKELGGQIIPEGQSSPVGEVSSGAGLSIGVPAAAPLGTGNSFNVIDFLDSFLEDAADVCDEGEDINETTFGSSGVETALPGFRSDPWAVETKSRASAYGIAVEESNEDDKQVDDAAIVHAMLASSSVPLLSPSSILRVSESQSVDEDDEDHV